MDISRIYKITQNVQSFVKGHQSLHSYQGGTWHYHYPQEKSNFLQLKQRVASIDDNCQLIVVQSDPCFQIQVNIVYNNLKKLVGFVGVDLNKWINNQTNHQIQALQDSPGAKAQIEYEFVYYQTNIAFKGQKILMFQSIDDQSKKQKLVLQKIELQNFNLLSKNQKLNKEKTRLQTQKRYFSNQTTSETKTFQDEVFQFDSEIIKMQNEQVFINQELIKQQQKGKFLIQLIQNSGSVDLMNSFQSFKSQYSQNSKQFDKINNFDFRLEQ